MAYYCVKNHVRECDGCMDCRSGKSVYCPVCGEEIYEKAYVNRDNDIVGCENCICEKEPYEVLEDEDY